MNWFKKAQQIVLFRGKMAHGQEGHYYSPDKEFARQFTQSGRDEEIIQISMDSNQIYRRDPLPQAYGVNENDIDDAIREAMAQGYKAIWVDEGQGEPDSVFVI